jgi:hypothetical protein
MMLSPLGRTLCFALVSGAALQLALEFLLWCLTPSLAAMDIRGSVRRVERRLLARTLSARLLPWIVALGLLVPAYLRGEDNAAPERVGWLCILSAVAVLAWLGLTLTRAAMLSVRVGRLCRSCCSTGRVIEGYPVLEHGESRSLMAVAGMLRSRLVVSSNLLSADGQGDAGLTVAFRHEAAHAAHRDNLKLFLLAILPSPQIATAASPSLQDNWRLAAELAADEESTQGDARLSLRLAEVLVTLARVGHPVASAGMATLLASSCHLEVRVRRLVGRATASSDAAAPHDATDTPVLMVLAIAVGCAAITSACLVYGHPTAELLLHLL